MPLDHELEMLATRIKLRIAFVAAPMADFDNQAGLRRFDLTPRVTIYSHLYAISKHSLLDVETNRTSMMELVEEHFANSSVVRAFNVANGTNVRLCQGESIICRGYDEIVSMKLGHDGLVTYQDDGSSERLLTQVFELLEDRVRIDVSRVVDRTQPLYGHFLPANSFE